MQQGEGVADSTPGAVKAAPAPLDAEELAQRAAAARHVSAMLGDAVAMLARSPHYKHYALADLEWLLAPPLALGQCFIATAQDKTTGFAAPIGLLLWAQVSDEVDRWLTENVGQPMRLRPDEWKSGEIAWLVAAEGDPRVLAGMLQKIRKDKLGGRVVKGVVVGEGGKRQVLSTNTEGAAP